MSNSIITFIITDPRDSGFTQFIYAADAIMDYGNAIVIHKPKHLETIVENAISGFQFRVLIHLGLKGQASPTGFAYADFLRQKEYFKDTKFTFITREQEKFPNDEDSIEDKGKRIYNANKINNQKFIDSVQVFNKTGQSVITSTKNDSQESGIVVLTALTKGEYEHFRNNMEKVNDAAKYFKGTFKKVEGFENDFTKPLTLLRQENMGMVESSAFTTRAILEHKPNVLIMAGVCGGRKSKVKLFDIIIPKQIVEFTTGKLENNQIKTYDYSSYPNSDLFAWITETQRMSKIKNNMKMLIPNDEKHKKENEILSKLEFHYESMACVPWVVKTEKFLEENAVKYNEKIQGLEMESYGVMRTTEVNSSHMKYALVVKSVMDYTDTDKQDEVAGINVKDTAAYMSYICVRAMMPFISDFLESQKNSG